MIELPSYDTLKNDRCDIEETDTKIKAVLTERDILLRANACVALKHRC